MGRRVTTELELRAAEDREIAILDTTLDEAQRATRAAHRALAAAIGPSTFTSTGTVSEGGAEEARALELAEKTEGDLLIARTKLHTRINRLRAERA